MTARLAGIHSSLAVVVLTAACTTYYEIPIETPIRATLDVSMFQRVLVAGFIAGGTEEVDGNLETTRLLRSQLRTQSEMLVIDTDVLPLLELASEGRESAQRVDEGSASIDVQNEPGPIENDEDLEHYEHIFANVEYWQRIGEEYQEPLIITGTVMFGPQARSGIVQRDQEVFDAVGRRRVIPTRSYMERKGFVLRPRFIFIDGRSGTVLHSETFREEVLYSINQATPALSSYFELMDRLLPSLLNTLTSQTIKGTRVLLR